MTTDRWETPLPDNPTAGSPSGLQNTIPNTMSLSTRETLIAATCRCGHLDGQHFDEVKSCSECECAAFRTHAPRKSTLLDIPSQAR